MFDPPIKTFRDLEIYKTSTTLSAEIFGTSLPAEYQTKEKFKNEFNVLYLSAKNVPRLIAEASGDKFTNLNSAMQKM